MINHIIKESSLTDAAEIIKILGRKINIRAQKRPDQDAFAILDRCLRMQGLSRTIFMDVMPYRSSIFGNSRDIKNRLKTTGRFF